jgi:hypothetical protein
MKEKNMYTTDIDEINLRVDKAGLRNVFTPPMSHHKED